MHTIYIHQLSVEQFDVKVKVRLLWLDCGLVLDHLHLCITVILGVNIFHPASLKFVRVEKGWTTGN